MQDHQKTQRSRCEADPRPHGTTLAKPLASAPGCIPGDRTYGTANCVRDEIAERLLYLATNAQIGVTYAAELNDDAALAFTVRRCVTYLRSVLELVEYLKKHKAEGRP